MFFNFIKITLRNLWKNKSYVIINLFGLGFSLACCIVAYLNYDFVASYDRNHLNHERIYKIHSYKTVQERKIPHGITSLPLGYQIKDKYPGVTHMSRYLSDGLVLKKDLKVFNQNIGFADDDFFEMFTFPFKYGNKSAFLDRSQIVLSEQASEAYFGDINPVGEIIYMITEEGEKIPMTVGGVLEKVPDNSSLWFRAITHIDNYLKIRELDNSDWSRFISATFIMTDPGVYPQQLLDDINANYLTIQNEARTDFILTGYFLQQLTTLGKNAENLRYNWLSEPPPPPAITVPYIMAILMLLIACFNFTNTSIAISSKRLKEIGVRKVMGSGRRSLIMQFMGENLMLSFLSMLLALGISGILVPAYSALWDFINLKLDLTSNPEIYLFLLGLLVATSIVAGGYPSLYISSYQPVNILRGNLSLGGTNIFSKVLLSVQYLLTFLALISALAFSNNAKYQSNLDLGFAKENIIGVQVESQSEYEKFANLVKQLPNVTQAVGSFNHIGSWHYSRTLRNKEAEVESKLMYFSLDYHEIMDLKVLDGRYFDKDLYEFDRQNSIIVNEAFVKELGWQEPLGEVLQLNDTTRLTVVGVMKDFYMYGFFDPVEPSAFRLGDRDRMNYLVVKGTGDPTKMYEQLESKWYEIAPDTPFNADYQDEAVKEATFVNKNIMVMFRFLGLLALALSSIGLYTLVSLNIIKRIKEIGVRKVLGASVQQIIFLINKQFIWLLLIAAVLGSFFSYFAIDALMGLIFSQYQALSVTTVALPVSFLLFIALAIASSRIFRSAVRNPVESLRYE